MNYAVFGKLASYADSLCTMSSLSVCVCIIVARMYIQLSMCGLVYAAICAV